MGRTIKCSNSNCLTTIPVPDNVSYVSCPSCGTFYFPSDFDSDPGQKPGDFYQQSPVEPPPSAWPPMDREITPEPPIFQSNDHIWQPETPRFAEPKQEINSPADAPVGFLVKYDGEQLPLKVGTNIIGRKEGDLLIPDKTVSRKHCIIEVTPKAMGGGWNFFISDIGQLTGTASTNGVFIDNRSIRLENYERIPISPGMIIQLGSVRLQLRSS